MKNLLKLSILFLIMAFQIMPVFAKNIAFTVISDTYLNVDKKENKMTPSIRKLLQAVEQANADTSNFIVFLGNNINSADRINLAMFSKIINKAQKPVYTVVGNKDVNKSRGIIKKEYYRILNKFSANKIKSLPCYQRYDDLILIFLAGVNEAVPSNKGYYKTAELDFLDKTLTKFANKKVIIFQHFPVVPPKADNEKATIKADKYLKVLDSHKNVLAVVSGHYNMENVIERNGVTHISVGSLGQSGEYEQVKIFKNKDGSYTIIERVFDVIKEENDGVINKD